MTENIEVSTKERIKELYSQLNAQLHFAEKDYSKEEYKAFLLAVHSELKSIVFET